MRADGDDGAMGTGEMMNFLDKRPHRPHPGIYQGQSKVNPRSTPPKQHLRGGGSAGCKWQRICRSKTVLECFCSGLECAAVHCATTPKHACEYSGSPLYACYRRGYSSAIAATLFTLLHHLQASSISSISPILPISTPHNFPRLLPISTL